MNGMIIVLSGPSGAGKGRMTRELLARRDNIRKVLSFTTRARRKDDNRRNTYHFISEEKFLEMKEKEMFFETNYYDGAWYGTLKIPIEELTERDLIFDKDVNGALAIKEVYPEAITIYIMPKDNTTLIKRRGKRGSGRAKIAIEEIEKAKKLDFLLINHEAEETVLHLEAIIECMRHHSMKNPKSIDFMNNFYQ